MAVTHNMNCEPIRLPFRVINYGNHKFPVLALHMVDITMVKCDRLFGCKHFIGPRGK
jgi:hypothetical protein